MSKTIFSIISSLASRFRRSIYSIIRSRQGITIGCIAALLMVALFTSHHDSVGSCQKQASIKFFDESGGGDALFRYGYGTPTGTIDSPYRNYVAAISKYFFLKVDKELGHCNGNSSSDPQIELVFVYRPLYIIDEKYRTVPFKFVRTQADDTRYLDSPWVKLTLTRSPKLVLRAAVVWNERQFLLDQAVLSGARSSPTEPPLTLDFKNYMKFKGDYSGNYGETLSASKEVRAAVFVDVAKRLPVDLMWLFLHSGYRDGQLETETARFKILEQLVAQHIDLTKALLNRRFESMQTEQQYSSILDLKPMFDLKRYRVEGKYH